METGQRAKCSRRAAPPRPLPPRFPWGQSWGGGALAGLQQQMWPVQGWRGGRRGGTVPGSRALGRGRPGLDAVRSLGLGVCHLQDAPQIPRALSPALGAPG